MHTQILSQAAALDHVDHEAAHKRYRELLGKPSPTPKEAKEMRDLLATLDMSVQDAYDDVEKFKLAHELRARVKRARGSETRIEAVRLSLEACDHERDQAVAAFRARRVALEGEQAELFTLQNSANLAIVELNTLKASAGLILVDVPALTTAEVYESLTAVDAPKTTAPQSTAA